MNSERENGPWYLRPAAVPGGLILPTNRVSLVIFLMMALASIGCNNDGIERTYHSPYPPAYLIAVVPFRDQSGSENLDVMAVTDEFYAELQQVAGSLQVIPVNRVLAALNELGLQNIASPDEVMILAENLGVDGVIVGTVTRYNPYRPPQMGMALQLYIREEKPEVGESLKHVDPGKLARSPRPVSLSVTPPLRPRAMVVRIFDAGRNEVIERIKEYAHKRGGDRAPSGWKKFTTSRNFLRFVCYEMIGELLAQEQQRLVGTSR